jgi:hypothetical protein
VKGLWLLVMAGTMMFSACAGSSSNRNSQIPLTLSGNWQFTMAPPADGSFSGGLQGGFLLQKNTAVTGAAAYSVSLSANPNPTVCSSGSAAITGTLTGQEVALTAVAGTQTFAFTGTLSLDSSTMGGTYTSTASTGCGTAQTGLQWNAILVPPLTGSIQGSFYSSGGAAGLNEQDFLVSGALSQAANTGTDNSAVTGNLNFLNPTTNVSDYPCFGVASVNGQISGNTLTLQILGTGGSTLGQIGETAGSAMGLNPVTVNSAPGGSLLEGIGASYLVATTTGPCMGSLGNTTAAGDFGSLCLALNGASACQQPITLTPSGLTFPSQSVNSPATKQTITLADPSGAALMGLTLNLTNNSDQTNFAEKDNCVPEGESLPSSSGQTISPPFALGGLLEPQFCTITIYFAPLETCASGSAQCPSRLTATLNVNIQNDDMIFTVPITGTAVSSDALSTSQFDFGAGWVWQAGPPQLVWSPNQSRRLMRTLPGSSNHTFPNLEHHANTD